MKRIPRNYRAIRLDQFIPYIYSLEECHNILHAYDPDCSEFIYFDNTFRLRGNYVYFYNFMDSTDELCIDICFKSRLVHDNWEILRKFIYLSSFSNKFDGKELVNKISPIDLPFSEHVKVQKIVINSNLTITFTIKDCKYKIGFKYSKSGSLFIGFYEFLDSYIMNTIFQEFYNKNEIKDVEDNLAKILNEIQK